MGILSNMAAGLFCCSRVLPTLNESELYVVDKRNTIEERVFIEKTKRTKYYQHSLAFNARFLLFAHDFIIVYFIIIVRRWLKKNGPMELLRGLNFK